TAALSFPQMMVGPLEGRFLEMLAFALQARRVLEIGTFSGYSSLSMAAGMPPEGTIVTCEISERHAEVARRHIASSPYAGRIDVRVGPAMDTLGTLQGPFDLVFIDADKTSYDAYFESVLPKVAAGARHPYHGRMLDYHVHLWPHGERAVGPTLEQLAAYCERASASGVGEVAVTEHLFRFVQADTALAGWWEDDPDPHLRASAARYWTDPA